MRGGAGVEVGGVFKTGSRRTLRAMHAALHLHRGVHFELLGQPRGRGWDWIGFRGGPAALHIALNFTSRYTKLPYELSKHKT